MIQHGSHLTHICVPFTKLFCAALFDNRKVAKILNAHLQLQKHFQSPGTHHAFQNEFRGLTKSCFVTVKLSETVGEIIMWLLAGPFWPSPVCTEFFPVRM